jgi:hypothetical protein
MSWFAGMSNYCTTVHHKNSSFAEEGVVENFFDIPFLIGFHFD